MAAVAIRGTTYPVVLPKLRDPRLHLAATITSLQVLGQVAFHFRLSIAQILICLGTVAAIEVAITARKQHVLMWPASALLTGNGVAFVLRVPGTEHGDWWSTRGWWIFAGTAGGALLSKYVITWKGEHIFNPSNIGLVVVFLALGRTRVEPLDFWWGPMSWWMALALAIIVSGGFAILRRLALLRVALSFWAAFAVGIGIVALGGHAMTARWHLGPIEGLSFWWVLVTSPEVLVFLFFMITDPKTAPRDPRTRIVYGVTLGFLASALIAPTTTEFAAKVSLLSALAIVCVAKALPVRLDLRVLVLAGAAAFASMLAFANSGTAHVGAAALPQGRLPRVVIDPSPGVQTQLDRTTAEQIAYGVVRVRPVYVGDVLHVHLVPGTDQAPPAAVATLAGSTYRLSQTGAGAWALDGAPPAVEAQPTLASSALKGTRLVDIASSLGIDFRQGAFSSGVTNEVKAMMGGGVCWLDANGDGRLDLFAVNSYAGTDAVHPTSKLYENEGRRFRDVTGAAHAGLAVQGDGCAVADLDGNGAPDIVVSTTTGVDVLWNHGGTFTEQGLAAPSGWYTGVAISDVNGDGRPDVFVAGYSDPNEPVPGSVAGFPTNLQGVRDLLFLNRPSGFREVGVAAGLEASAFRHGLGAEFMDVNHDGRPDLYVANDEDPNDLYVDVPWPGGAKADPAGLGFRFEDRAPALGVADPFAGMGIAAGDGKLLVTNSRNEASAAFTASGGGFANDRKAVDGALGSGFAGWGASWVDLANTGTDDLVLTAGAIPVKSLARDAEAIRVLAPVGSKYGVAPVFGKHAPVVEGRGLAVADAFNDGRETIAVNTIGGKLLLLQPAGPSGHWIDVAVKPATPGTVVTVVLPNGRRMTKTIVAGGSYLSSEDPRLHFGLGTARRVKVIVNGWTVYTPVGIDRVVTVTPPRRALAASSSPTRCTHAHDRRSIARIWNDTAVRALRLGNVPDAVQARDLYDLSALIARVPPTRMDISYAAYRLLVWQASYGANVSQVFSLLTKQLEALCGDPSFTGGAGNALARAAIRGDAGDGSNEALHFADSTFSPRNAPLVVGQRGSTVHDATFWQPLSFGRDRVQVFVGAQWGRVRTFATHVHVASPQLGDPSSRAYRAAAIAVIRDSSGPSAVIRSPADWNAGLPSLGLTRDIRLDLALNGALNDAAVSVYAAKRTFDAPRPISMIRYLAFNGQLPVVAGATRRVGGVTQVKLHGHWVRGDEWTVPTPPSPGYPSATAAYAYAAATVLHRPVTHAQSGLANGTELPADVAAGAAIGRAAGRAALAKLR